MIGFYRPEVGCLGYNCIIQMVWSYIKGGCKSRYTVFYVLLHLYLLVTTFFLTLFYLVSFQNVLFQPCSIPRNSPVHDVTHYGTNFGPHQRQLMLPRLTLSILLLCGDFLINLILYYALLPPKRSPLSRVNMVAMTSVPTLCEGSVKVVPYCHLKQSCFGQKNS